MPTYLLTSPDGKKYRVSGEGTGEEALSQLQSRLGSSQSEPKKVEQPETAQPRNSTVDSFVRGGAQTYSMGFGDEIMAGLTAPVMYGASRLMDVPGFSDKGFIDTYKQLRDNERKQIKEAESDNPKSYYTGMAAGAIANPAKFTGNIAVQGLKYGAASGLGDSEADSLSGMVGDAAEGAGYGYAGGKLLQGAGKLANAGIKGAKNAVKGFNARGVEALESSAGQIDDVASTAFKNMRQSGTVFNRPKIVNITNKVEKFLNDDTKLNARLHGDTMGILDDFKKAARAGDFDFESLHQYRRLFNGVVKKNMMNNPDDARLAKMAIGRIDDEIARLRPIDVRGGNLGAAKDLQTGLKEWSKLRKFETISGIVERSQGDVNYLKRELTKIANNPRKYGFSGNELSALKDASKLTSGEAVLKVLGKAGFDPARLGSGVGAFFGSTAGGVLGGTTGAAVVPIAGTAAKYGQKLVGRGKTERLLEAIEKGSYKPATGVNIPNAIPQATGRVIGAFGGESASDPNQTTINPADVRGPDGQPARLGVNSEGDVDYLYDPNETGQPQSSLFQRVIQQESGGKQFDKDGKPLTSKAGAIGIAQVMPDTAPEAAKLAGVPFNATKYRKDPEYNALLGEAYLNKQLEDFGGNEIYALAAYNMGPGATRKWIRRGADLNKLNPETRNYIKSILGV